MADGEGFEGDHEEGTTTTATSFSQLLFADDDVVSLDVGQSFYFNTTTSTEKPPKMLCFGSYENEDEFVITTTFDGASATKKSSTPQKSKATSKSRVTCTATDSSPASSGNNGGTTVTTLSKSSRKRNGSDQEPVRVTAKPAIGPRSSKVKTESPTSTGLKKVRREKLGERVATLQHLVSPFGKTDTASVLHEAMGYIKFLQDQVQVLCSPYLQRHQPEGGENGEEESRKDLSSRGLCLVPVAYTVNVASSNGADFWSSSVGNQ